MAKSNKIRVRLKAFDHQVLDLSVEKIVNAAKSTGAGIVGPIPQPTDVEKITINRAVHKYKDAREQFEIRTHKRLIEIVNPTKQTMDALKHLDLASGVEIQIKL